MPEQRRFVTQSPENSETPLADVHGWVTPTRQFVKLSLEAHFRGCIGSSSWFLIAAGSTNARQLIILSSL